MALLRRLILLLLVVPGIIACTDKPAREEKPVSQEISNDPKVLPPSSAYASDKEGWLVNLEEAYAQSVKQNKPILANFTGSDWCGWCKRLDQDVFTTPTFKSWAAKNVVLLEVDFPRRKRLPEKNQEQNAAMAKSLNVTGYPTVWLLNVTREVENGRFKVSPLGKTGYMKTPEEFIGALQAVMSR
jgi:thiol:disulfide interchange protein